MQLAASNVQCATYSVHIAMRNRQHPTYNFHVATCRAANVHPSPSTLAIGPIGSLRAAPERDRCVRAAICVACLRALHAVRVPSRRCKRATATATPTGARLSRSPCACCVCASRGAHLRGAFAIGCILHVSAARCAPRRTVRRHGPAHVCSKGYSTVRVLRGTTRYYTVLRSNTGYGTTGIAGQYAVLKSGQGTRHRGAQDSAQSQPPARYRAVR